MRRRDFLKVTGSAAAAGGTVLGVAASAAATPSVPQQVDQTALRRLRLATSWPDETHGPGDHVRRFAARLATAMGERWQIDVSTAAASSAQAGCDLRIGSAADALPGEPAAAFFDGLPAFTGLDADGLAAWLGAAGGQDLWDELGARQGVKPLLVGHTGAPLSLWSRGPLEGPDDFAGRRIAVRGLARDVVRGLGGVVVEVAPDRIASALADGNIDIAEAPDASLATRVALAATGATGYLSPFNPDGNSIVLHMPLDLWWQLTPGDRMVVGALAAEAFATHRDELLAEHPLARALIGYVPRLAAMPTALTAGASWIAADAVSAVAGSHPHARRINQSYMTFRDHHRRREAFAAG